MDMINKTVRNEVFETNSSSTHSICIAKITKETYKPLSENGILYPSRLSQYTQLFRESSEGDDERTICTTQEQKAAIVALWLRYLEFDDSEFEALELREYFLTSLGYESINFEEDSNDFYPYDDSNDILLPNSMENLTKLIEIILDDSMKIVESNETW